MGVPDFLGCKISCDTGKKRRAAVYNLHVRACTVKERSTKMAVLTSLLFLSCVAWLVRAQAGTQCTPIVGQPGCVCRHPDGIIDLTKIANTNGTPR